MSLNIQWYTNKPTGLSVRSTCPVLVSGYFRHYICGRPAEPGGKCVGHSLP